MSTDARREALNKLEQKYPDIFSKYDTEYEKLKNIKKIKEEIARLEAGESISNPANELKRVDDRIKELDPVGNRILPGQLRAAKSPICPEIRTFKG